MFAKQNNSFYLLRGCLVFFTFLMIEVVTVKMCRIQNIYVYFNYSDNLLFQNYQLFVGKHREKIKKAWEGKRICLLIRTFHGDFPILNMTLLSSSIFWPDSLGEKVIIFDYGEEKYKKYCEERGWDFYTERFDDPIKTGFVGKQWSNFYPEKYCKKSDYVAISDTDAIFSTYVSPDLLFNRSGFPYIQVSKTFQKHLWKDVDKILNVPYHLNGMVKLPFLMKIKHIIQCRNYIIKLFNQNLSSILCKYSHFSQMCVFATYAFFFHKNDYNFVFENNVPLMQYAIHIPYNTHASKKSAKYYNVCNSIIINGICSTPFFKHHKCNFKKFNHFYYWHYASLYWANITDFSQYFENHIKNLIPLFN